MPSNRWDDLWQGQHARAFMVAGVTRDAVLSSFREAVDAAIEKGETLDDFRKRFDEIVKKNGWPFPGRKDSEGYRAWRTSVIYHTNLRTAYMAGRWATLKKFPFLKYKHNSVRNPREQHLHWDGLVLPTDDPWWQVHYPPNGWGCRCSAIGMSAARMRADGITPNDAPAPTPGDPPPEWAYNVGEASSGNYIDPTVMQAERGGKLVPLDPRGPTDFNRPAKMPVDETALAPLVQAETATAIRAEFRKVEGQYTDPTGAQVNVTSAIVEHWLEDVKRAGRERYIPFLPSVIEDPYEIWVGFARNELTGQIYLRRRYAKAIRIGKNKYLSMVFDAIDGKWASFNAFVGNAPSNDMRAGRLLWGR